jgi:metal-responsive CopG/Arc/MetJ family transcriptional regulator
MAKTTVSFTVDQNVAKEFNKYADENAINKSALVEKLIKEYLKKK